MTPQEIERLLQKLSDELDEEGEDAIISAAVARQVTRWALGKPQMDPETEERELEAFRAAVGDEAADQALIAELDAFEREFDRFGQ